jgi:hypothetical protein
MKSTDFKKLIKEAVKRSNSRRIKGYFIGSSKIP